MDWALFFGYDRRTSGSRLFALTFVQILLFAMLRPFAFLED